MMKEYSLDSSVLVTPLEIKTNTSVLISDGRIKGFNRSKIKNIKIGDEYVVFPALINAHDHLFGTYYPKIGNGPYICWLPWDYDLKSSPIYAERNKNTPLDIYLIGAYKNLISGVTTVHDHIPHEINDPLVDKLPIRVITRYSLSHEASAYDLKWGEGIEIEFKKAVKEDIPFVTHIEEGFDEESLRGIDILESFGALDDHTVLIHGIGFSKSDIERIAKKKANFIWCPGSNMFMFNRTAKIKEIIEAGVNVSIGTDSPATGELNLLEEVRFGKKVYKELYGEDLDDKLIVLMITINPARAFRILDELGTIEEGKLADILVVRANNNKNNPYSSIVEAKLEDIALVIMEGRPLYGDEVFEELFEESGNNHTKITIEGRTKLVAGNPKALMDKIRNQVGFNKFLPFLPI